MSGSYCSEASDNQRNTYVAQVRWGSGVWFGGDGGGGDGGGGSVCVDIRDVYLLYH